MSSSVSQGPQPRNHTSQKPLPAGVYLGSANEKHSQGVRKCAAGKSVFNFFLLWLQQQELSDCRCPGPQQLRTVSVCSGAPAAGTQQQWVGPATSWGRASGTRVLGSPLFALHFPSALWPLKGSVDVLGIHYQSACIQENRKYFRHVRASGNINQSTYCSCSPRGLVIFCKYLSLVTVPT